MSLLLNQVRETIFRSLLESGTRPDAAQAAADAAVLAMQSEFAGDRIYVAKSKELEMMARNRAIIQEWRSGERVAFIARRYGITERRVRMIIAG